MPAAPYPEIDQRFGDWLAGFIDGEGSFSILKRVTPDPTSYVCRFAIGLRDDDLPILEEIYARTGVGHLAKKRALKNRGQPEARWQVVKKRDLLRLVEILDAHPLRAKKARDYAIWREAVLLWAQTQLKRNRWGALPCDWSRIASLHRELKAIRAYAAPTTHIPLQHAHAETQSPPTLWD